MHNEIRERGQVEDWREIVSEIEVLPEHAEGLEGVEECSHLVVLFYLSQVPNRYPPEERKGRVISIPHNESVSKGVFATRTAHRPNPIGVTTVRLLEREANRLTVQGLDAFDGTPILDIKPYTIRYELRPEATFPDWMGWR